MPQHTIFFEENSAFFRSPAAVLLESPLTDKVLGGEVCGIRQKACCRYGLSNLGIIASKPQDAEIGSHFNGFSAIDPRRPGRF